MRERYRALPFPRNPNLKHRYWVKEAEAAWDDGSKTVIALCGEPMTVKVDPRRPSKGNDDRDADGYVVPKQLSDIEYTDLDTGLEWIDMSCVDCCRVANDYREQTRREYLVWAARVIVKYSDKMPRDLVDGLYEAVHGVGESIEAVQQR